MKNHSLGRKEGMYFMIDDKYLTILYIQRYNKLWDAVVIQHKVIQILQRESQEEAKALIKIVIRDELGYSYKIRREIIRYNEDLL